MSPESLFLATTTQDIQDFNNMNSEDLNLFFSSQNFQHDAGLQQDFSLDILEAPADGSLPGASNPNLTWGVSSLDHRPVDTSNDYSLEMLIYHIQSLDTQVRSLDTQVRSLDTQVRSLDVQVRSLDARIQAAEALHQRAEDIMDDFKKWSNRMERHWQEIDNAVSGLTKMVRTLTNQQ
ncbi:hypothetical protein F4678DRAFT_477520 [Xylaria arbuscula]|nr:hypothetical protein F4678DRAFT_477520 [Xylaria arbuscula]